MPGSNYYYYYFQGKWKYFVVILHVGLLEVFKKYFESKKSPKTRLLYVQRKPRGSLSSSAWSHRFVACHKITNPYCVVAVLIFRSSFVKKGRKIEIPTISNFLASDWSRDLTHHVPSPPWPRPVLPVPARPIPSPDPPDPVAKPGWVQQLSHKYLNSPEFIDLVGEDDVKIPTTITHWSYATQRDTRVEILGLVATVYGADKRSIVFTQVMN